MPHRIPVPGTRARVAVVDESVLQRHRSEQLLADALRVDIVHSGATLPELAARLQRTDRAHWPHVLVLGAPSEFGQEHTLRTVGAFRNLGIRVLVLAAPRSRELTQGLLERGLDGLVSTTDSEQTFLDSVETVLVGGIAITPRAQEMSEAPDRRPKLSDQEHRVFLLYTSGLAIAEVASEIGVRPDTARKYLSRVRAKYTSAGYRARTKLELARIAWDQGLRRRPSSGTPGAPGGPSTLPA